MSTATYLGGGVVFGFWFGVFNNKWKTFLWIWSLSYEKNHKVQSRKWKIQNIPLTAKFRKYELSENPRWCQQTSRSLFSFTTNCHTKQWALTLLLSKHSRTECARGDPLWSWGWGMQISQQPSCSLSCPACSQRWELQPSVNPRNDAEHSE